MNNAAAGALWARAAAGDLTALLNRWHVAKHAYTIVGNRREGEELALAGVLASAGGQNPINPDERNHLQTVYRLARAYAVFLVLYRQDSQRAKAARRKYTYTRFETLAGKMREYEINPDRLFDYLDIEGGNRAMGAFIDNAEHPAEEWLRRATSVNKQAGKLVDDLGVPDPVRQAARAYMEAFDAWQKQTKPNQ